MDRLNLPAVELRRNISEDGSPLVFDVIRKKYVNLSPEEWVRQHFIHYLLNQLQYPAGLVRVESGHRFNNMPRRSDILVYLRTGEPFMIIECKKPEEELNEKVLDQIWRYNSVIGARYAVLTNGIKHYCCSFDPATQQYAFIDELPEFPA